MPEGPTSPPPGCVDRPLGAGLAKGSACPGTKSPHLRMEVLEARSAGCVLLAVRSAGHADSVR